MNHIIYCLQDNHFTLETNNDITTLWAMNAILINTSQTQEVLPF